MPSPEEVKSMIESAGGKVSDMTLMPDGHGNCVASFPLPKDHWLYEEKGFNVPPMPFRMGQNNRAVLEIFQSPYSLHAQQRIPMDKETFENYIREVGKYAIRCATMNGKTEDFDPDALLQNLVVGFLGYWTETGLSRDEFANPPEAK